MGPGGACVCVCVSVCACVCVRVPGARAPAADSARQPRPSSALASLGRALRWLCLFNLPPKPNPVLLTRAPQAEAGSLPRPGNAADAAKLFSAAEALNAKAAEANRVTLDAAAKALLQKFASGAPPLPALPDPLGAHPGKADLWQGPGAPLQRGRRLLGALSPPPALGRECLPPHTPPLSSPPASPGSSGELNPMAAMFGGMVGQEVVKAASGKFTPLHQARHGAQCRLARQAAPIHTAGLIAFTPRVPPLTCKPWAPHASLQIALRSPSPLPCAVVLL